MRSYIQTRTTATAASKHTTRVAVLSISGVTCKARATLFIALSVVALVPTTDRASRLVRFRTTSNSAARIKPAVTGTYQLVSAIDSTSTRRAYKKGCSVCRVRFTTGYAEVGTYRRLSPVTRPFITASTKTQAGRVNSSHSISVCCLLFLS
jgi:hypothetical protein